MTQLSITKVWKMMCKCLSTKTAPCVVSSYWHGALCAVCVLTWWKGAGPLQLNLCVYCKSISNQNSECKNKRLVYGEEAIRTASSWLWTISGPQITTNKQCQTKTEIPFLHIIYNKKFKEPHTVPCTYVCVYQWFDQFLDLSCFRIRNSKFLK